MKIRLCLIMACLLLVGCQAQRAKIASLWSSEEVVEDAADDPTLMYLMAMMPI